MSQELYDGVLDLFVRLRASHSQRNGECDLARQRYSGVMWDSATNAPPVDRYSLTMNYLKPFVDKSIQLIVGRMPAIQVMPNGTDEAARRQAEDLEGILYATWEANEAADVLFRVAFDSFVLRRGLIYYWWDPAQSRVRFRHCIPDNFYPEYDGDEVYQALYVHKRPTAALKEEYPDYADLIFDDPGSNLAQLFGQDQPRMFQAGSTTVIDWYHRDGRYVRIMGEAVLAGELNYPTPEVPFIDFPCFIIGGETEPQNLFDQFVELNQYLCQLVSQKADIIKKFSNPTIVDYGSGQTPESVRRAVQADGAVIPARQGSNIELLTWSGQTPGIDEQMQFVLDALFDLAGKPRSSFGQTITNQSGVVTNLALTPTLQSNEYHETLWGRRLSILNQRILELWETFAGGELLSFQGRVPSGITGQSGKYMDTAIMGDQIRGWYKNRIKWPSAIRTDDPAYVQNDLQQLQSDPPAISLYTSLENRGIEDVEAEIDRINQQLMDPRMHPDRLQAAMNAATTWDQNAMAGGATGADGSQLMAAGAPNVPAVVGAQKAGG